MEIIARYVAKDGQEFNNENDCLKHEQQLILFSLAESCLFIDSCGNEINIDDVIDEFDSVKYVFVKTDEAAETLQDLLSENYRTPWDSYGYVAGAWTLDDNYDCWKSLADLEEEVNQFRYYAPEWVD